MWAKPLQTYLFSCSAIKQSVILVTASASTSRAAVEHPSLSLLSALCNNLVAEALTTVTADLSSRLTFHDRCGTLVKLSNSGRTAERQRALDEFNNGVVMTARPLRDNERFEVVNWRCIHLQNIV